MRNYNFKQFIPTNPRRAFFLVSLFALILAGALLFSLPFPAEAADSRVVLPLVPCTGIDCNVCHLYEGIRRIMNFLLFTAVLPLLVISLLAAGVLYLISGGSERWRTMAKDILWYAAMGTLLAFTAWVIVNTLLDTLGFKIPFGPSEWTNTKICEQFDKLRASGQPGGGGPPPPAGPPPPGGPPPPTPAGTLTHAEAAARLSAAGIAIRSSGNCSDQSNPACTSLQGVPASAVDELIRIDGEMETMLGSSDLAVNGWTEVGHDTHGTGKSILDLDNTVNTNRWISTRIGTTNPQQNTWYQDRSTNNRYYYYEGNHWHVCLNTLDCPQAVGAD